MEAPIIVEAVGILTGARMRASAGYRNASDAVYEEIAFCGPPKSVTGAVINTIRNVAGGPPVTNTVNDALALIDLAMETLNEKLTGTLS